MDGIIVVHKEKGLTSHDVVGKLRKILKTKKVGHAGTLDPDATGVLVVCVNKATKVLQFLTADTKEYIATLKLGTATDTYDASGKVIEQKEVNLKDIDLVKVFNSFLGEQLQVPPIYSAIKINGKKAYEYARNGEQLVLEPRPINILEIQIIETIEDTIQFKVKCSKGTYIRSLCVDLAIALGTVGHMEKLVRSESGMFTLKDSYTLEQIENGSFDMLSIEDALSDYPKMIVEDENIIFHGKKIVSNSNEITTMYNNEGKLLAMYGPDGQGNLKNIRGLW